VGSEMQEHHEPIHLDGVDVVRCLLGERAVEPIGGTAQFRFASGKTIGEQRHYVMCGDAHRGFVLRISQNQVGVAMFFFKQEQFDN
jgi:hypothetical protein